MTDNPTCHLCGAGDGSSLSDSLRRMRACLDCDLDAAPPSCESHRAAILAYLTQTYGPEAVSEAWTMVLTKGAA